MKFNSLLRVDAEYVIPYTKYCNVETVLFPTIVGVLEQLGFRVLSILSPRLTSL